MLILYNASFRVSKISFWLFHEWTCVTIFFLHCWKSQNIMDYPGLRALLSRWWNIQPKWSEVPVAVLGDPKKMVTHDLVGGLGHFYCIFFHIATNPNFIFYFCFLSWVSNHPNWRSHIFQRGGSTDNQWFVLQTWAVFKPHMGIEASMHQRRWWVKDSWRNLTWWYFDALGGYLVVHPTNRLGGLVLTPVFFVDDIAPTYQSHW